MRFSSVGANASASASPLWMRWPGSFWRQRSRRGLRHLLREHRLRRRRSEGQRPCDRVEADDAERIDVAARVHGLASRLLWAHVLGRPQQLADGGLAARCREARDAEVRDHRASGATLEQDVGGLHVAVDDALRVRVSERPRDFPQHPRRVVRRQRAARRHALRQRLAVDVRHDVEDETARLVDRVDRNDVRMGESRRGARLAHEPVAQLRVRGELGRQQLDRDGAIETHLAREIHHAHSAATELALERVSAGDGFLKREKECVDCARHLDLRALPRRIEERKLARDRVRAISAMLDGDLELEIRSGRAVLGVHVSEREISFQ